MKVSIEVSDQKWLPLYQTSGAAACDLYAAITESVTIEPGSRTLVPTGIKLALPDGYEAQIRPRSGLALKHGITLTNTPGTIDSDYHGEIQVILMNAGQEAFTVQPGDRIAQMVLAKYERAEWEQVAALDAVSERGTKGFGSTGK